MPLLDTNNDFPGNMGLALRARQSTDNTRWVRPIEYFGAASVDFGATPSDNIVAFQDAVDWCINTGGQVLLGAGVYGIDGTLTLKSYSNFIGLGKRQSIVEQLSASVVDFFTTSTTAGARPAYINLKNFALMGPFSPGWGTSFAGDTVAAALRLTGDTGSPPAGPDEAAMLTREGVGGATIPDPLHIIDNMWIEGFRGYGIYTDGRGEIHITNNDIERCSLNGLNLNTPDCWLHGNSIRTTGDSAVVCSAGNQRFSDEKYWFTGLRTDTEGVGAGLEFTDPGIKNVIGSNLTLQDTWGPNLVLAGDDFLIHGQFDEAGGGRVEEQGFGITAGSRTGIRSFLRVDGARRFRIRGSINGGDRNGAGNRPYLVDFNTSGGDLNYIELEGDTATPEATFIREDSGYTSANRQNEVIWNGEMVHGRRTVADLSDVTHTINEDDGVQRVLLTAGGMALKDEVDGTWNVLVSEDESQTLTNKTIDGDNNTISNLDFGNEVDWAAAADVTDRTAFASGDKMVIFEAGVGFRKIDYDDLPGAGGGLANIVEDTTPQLGGSLDGQGNRVTGTLNNTPGSVSGALTAASHGNGIHVTSANVTIPATAGFSCILIAGGAHIVTFAASGGDVSAPAMAAGDVMTIVVESATVIHAVLTATADKVGFS